jgi:hypothetical protein
MSPTNGQADAAANVPAAAVLQAPPTSRVSTPTATQLTAIEMKDLIANLEVPFHPSVVEWRHQHQQGRLAAWPGYALCRPESLHRSFKYAGHSGGLDTPVHNSYQREF